MRKGVNLARTVAKERKRRGKTVEKKQKMYRHRMKGSREEWE